MDWKKSVEKSPNPRNAGAGAGGRRRFLKSAAVLPLALTGSGTVAGGEVSPELGGRDQPAQLPTVPFGDRRVSRLIVGGNPVNGGSHLSRMVDLSMREYFTDQRIQEFLSRCRAAGINTWQSGRDNWQHWERHSRSGEPLQYLSLAHAGPEGTVSIQTAVEKKFLGLAHHGEVTDRLFKAGQIESVREFLKKVRDSGLRVGVSTHMPAVIDYIESHDWDVDFYMTCVYERHRTREELKNLLGYIPLREREVYLEEDPPRMYRMIQATSRTCLAFKILAAGRLCQSPKTVEQAFKTTFENIKAGDAVIVGIFPRWTDQISDDAELVRRYGSEGANGLST